VVLGGRKVPIRRPRVRAAGGESEAVLETHQVAHAEDLSADHMAGAIGDGLSTRQYGAAQEPVGAAVEADAAGTSNSSVSRRFVNATADQFVSLMWLFGNARGLVMAEV
jgi:putative transposase